MTRQVEMIPIDAISVTNPRVRNAKVHQDITDNIGLIGLKRPITVRTMSSDGSTRYALVCGQGRLESCRALGHSQVPALVIPADEETALVMSIVENVARRSRSASDLLEQVGALHAKGYSDAEIGRKIGCTAAWVQMVLTLLRQGEQRLLNAVDAGQISLHLAIRIARAKGEEAQSLLLEAYEKGDLNAKNVSAMRQLLERRTLSGKSIYGGSPSKPAGKRMTAQQIARLYQDEAEQLARVRKKAQHARGMLELAQQIFRELLARPEFRALLEAEQLDRVPQPLLEAPMASAEPA